MDRIVTEPLKIDLHIHSRASFSKDGSLVSGGTIENLHILWEKLKSNNVDVFAITDHDRFDYDLYLANKEKERDHTFKKVFPGVEFSVKFLNRETNCGAPVHVIAIFNDTDSNKVQKIGEVLAAGANPYDDIGGGQFYSEEKFRFILSQIDLDVVLIAHQKHSLLSNYKNDEDDASSVGDGRFSEFINAEYFESYEFKSPRTGMFHRLYKFDNDRNDSMRFITGSDCHQWEFYPLIKENDREEMVFSYLKCLPTFRGLAMALTDSSRIRTDSNFFVNDQSTIDSVKINVNGRDVIAPLSPGINVIIGDNSIGKSMFLHAMTDFRSFDDSINSNVSFKTDYKNYLQGHNISVNTHIPTPKVYKFDSQGEIRRRFEAGDAFKQDFVQSKFPNPTDDKEYRHLIEQQFEKLFEAIQQRFDYQTNYKSLPSIVLSSKPEKSRNIVITKINNEEKTGTLFHIVGKIKLIKTNIIDLKSLFTDSEDLKELDNTEAVFDSLIVKYNLLLEGATFRNTLRDSVGSGITMFLNAQKAAMNKVETEWEDFQEEKSQIAFDIQKLVTAKVLNGPYVFSFDPLNVVVNRNPFGDVTFVNRFKGNKKIINKEYCDEILRKVLLSGKTIDLGTITKDGLTEIIKDRSQYVELSVLDLLKKKINDILDYEFAEEKAIVKNDGNDDANYSSGFNSSKYFSLIANDTSQKGIYIVDQPEDDVSQPSIKSSVIPDLRNMRECRQVILVTHNPQFVVNLDADNVLYFYDGKEGFDIKSGALEYINPEEDCDILKLVSDNLEGGIDSLKKRWKRYEKNTDID